MGKLDVDEVSSALSMAIRIRAVVQGSGIRVYGLGISRFGKILIVHTPNPCMSA